MKLPRLLGVLRAGEELAARVAARQSHLAAEDWMRRALAAQARQERGHAAVAAAVAEFFGGERREPPALQALGSQLERDLAAGDLTASLLGLQGVIEHLGEALLARLGCSSIPGDAVLHVLRERVLAQERGHLRLGAKCLAAVARGGAPPQRIAEYEALGLETARAAAALLDDARLDAEGFWREVGMRLAAWRRSGGLAA